MKIMLATLLIAAIIAGLVAIMGWYKSAVGIFLSATVAVLGYRGLVLQDSGIWTAALFCLLLLPVGWFGATRISRIQSAPAK